MKYPITLWPLAASLLFLAIGGLYGGTAMLADPSGNLLELAEVMPLLPVANLILPGLFLLLVMGLAPLGLLYGLMVRPNWKWAVKLTPWSGHHWAWTGTVILGLVLAVWLTVQGFLIGFKWAIQYVTAINDGLIILIALAPRVRNFYKEIR